MGLDQYLFRTTQKRVDAMADYEKRRREFLDWGNQFVKADGFDSFVETLPRLGDGCLDWAKATQEQKDRIERFRSEVRKQAERIGVSINEELAPVFDKGRYQLGEEDEPDEIAYFDRDWDLHKFIIEHFWKDQESDNLVWVPLTKENLNEIAKAGFYPDRFRIAAGCAAAGDVVCYHPWY